MLLTIESIIYWFFGDRIQNPLVARLPELEVIRVIKFRQKKYDKNFGFIQIFIVLLKTYERNGK